MVNDPTSQDITKRESIPLSLAVLGIFGQLAEWDENDERLDETPMLRYRLNTTDPDGEEYDEGLFVPLEGLMHPDGPHEFFHNDLSDDESEVDKIEDRAILFQSIENYEIVSKDPKMAPYFHLADKPHAHGDHQPLSLTDHEILKERALNDPRFGEQVIVEGAKPSDISIGDIFQVANGLSTLKVQVTCPRKSCYELDIKNKTPKGAKGIKYFTASKGLGGWFTSVLVGGVLKDGMTLVRTHHPFPKWTLDELSQAVYGGEGDPKTLLRGTASWGRSRAELQELLNMEFLCDYEWKEELVWIMDELKEEEEKAQEGAESSSFAKYFSWICDSACSLCFDADTFGCFEDVS